MFSRYNRPVCYNCLICLLLKLGGKLVMQWFPHAFHIAVASCVTKGRPILGLYWSPLSTGVDCPECVFWSPPTHRENKIVCFQYEIICSRVCNPSTRAVMGILATGRRSTCTFFEFPDRQRSVLFNNISLVRRRIMQYYELGQLASYYLLSARI